MNRQIKFRVWNGHSMEYRVLAGALGHFYVEGVSKKDSACLSDANTIYHESAPLMQFTGLLDRGGKEIWEDDILEYLYEDEDESVKLITRVYFNPNRACWTIYPFAVKSGGVDLVPCLKFFKVIGNIHANPELLK